MSTFGLSGLFIGLTCAAMAVWVYSSNRANKVNGLWAIFCVSVCIWGLGCFCIGFEKNPETAIRLWRVAYIGVIFIPSIFYHFVLTFLGRGRKKLCLFGYLLSSVFLVVDFTDLMMPSVKWMFDDIYYLAPPGVLYPAFVGFFVIYVVMSHVELLRFLKTTQHAQRKTQVRWFLVATSIGYTGGVTCFLPVFGFNIYPYGNFAVPLYPLIMTYAIVKHQLMDIEVVIRKTAVFAGLFAFVYGIFTIFSISGQHIFKKIFGLPEWAAMVPTVFLITLGLRPLEIFLTNITERFLFQKKYDYRQLLKTFANEILTILDLQKLMDETVAQLNRILKLDSACILLHQKNEKAFTIVASAGLKEKDVVFQESDLFIANLRDGHHPIQMDKASEEVDGDGRLKADFKKIKARLCLPIMLHDELIGVLALGMKKSGDDYTTEDIDILSTLARTEAIAISNAQLFDELSKTQAEAAQREKMAVIGTLAAGINHEICNPLGIVRGQCEMFLLNMRDGLYKDKTPEQLILISSDIMTKVIKETDRATGITKKLSSFAKPSRKNEAESVNVAKEADEILGLLGHDLKLSNIDFKFNLPGDFPDIFVDRKQFQEVLFNIIRNAAQAMDKKAGSIVVDGTYEYGTATVKISDNGMGIPKEKMNQIFNPFYTTKAPGKGTGLGLFIVKQIVERNKGTIEVESVEGEGTTFLLKFPAATKMAA